MTTMQIHPLFDCLTKDRLITIDEAMLATQHTAQSSPQQRVLHLVLKKLISSDALLHCLAKHYALPSYDLKQLSPPHTPHHLLMEYYELIYRYHLLPLKKENNTLSLGIADPTDQETFKAIAFQTGLRLKLYMVDVLLLHDYLQSFFKLKTQHALQQSLAHLPAEVSNQNNDDMALDTVEDGEDTPTISFMNHLLEEAIAKKVSDIHIEPQHKDHRIRFRMDGCLCETARLPKSFGARITVRLKLLARMNIAEKRMPQDGRIHHKNNLNFNMDIRINTCPTIYGEKLVLRLLDATKVKLDLTNLGFTTSQLPTFLHYINQPQGLILVTGPTGSGKTTTLYSALQYLNSIEKNIVTLEDPVEIELEGINQINVENRLGLDFATILRAILRQDPDIMMVGEIRDANTAEIAMQAAQTGHLVLSTLHTNSAVDTIIRFQSMRIPSYHLTSAISLIIAQRLLRKICSACLGQFVSSSCSQCNQGYHGRIAIFELLPMTPWLRALILANAPRTDFLHAFARHQQQTLWDHAKEIIAIGTTNLLEAEKILGTANDD